MHETDYVHNHDLTRDECEFKEYQTDPKPNHGMLVSHWRDNL